MTHFAQRSFAAIAAILIVSSTFAAVVTVPSANAEEVTVVAVPELA